MGRLRLVFFVVTYACFCLGSFAQARVSMRFPSATYLELGSGTTEVRTVERTLADARSILVLEIRPKQSQGFVEIPLIARSNTPYKLVMRVLELNGAEESAAIGLRMGQAAPYSGVTHLASNATVVHFHEVSVVSKFSDVSVLEGPRISKGGNNSTGDNALSIRLQVEIPASLTTASILLQMQPLP